MGSYATSKMSLLAQYDDLCRYTAVLTSGCEREFKAFVEVQRQFRQKTKDLESENRRLQQKVNNLETEKLRFETQLKHARNLLISGDEKFRKLEHEKNSLERQIALIKELLTEGNGIDNQTKEKLVQLSSVYSQQNDYLSRLTTIEESGSLLSSSDCDETSDGLDIYVNSRKRSSRNKLSSGDPFEDNKTLTEEVVPKRSMVTFRSSSEPNSTTPEAQAPRLVIRSDSDQIKLHPSDIRRKSTMHSRTSLPNGRYSTGGKLSRTHAFVAKTFIRSEKCHPCGKIIKFCKQALKCTDCRISCHPECKDQCSLPCIPVISTPVRGPLGTIADYTTSTAPMIPSLIVHCVNEIESRGLNDIGLYRIPGSEREVKELKEKFLKKKSVPSLNEIDVHALCGTVKEFLRSLKDSLITKAAWHTFVAASNHDDETIRLNSLHDAVCDLPQPNRETLAFLILHLQRIADSSLCKMPIGNLSKVFGPTIVGYSCDEPAESDLLMETKQQNQVMEGLLNIPAVFWQNLLNIESNIYSSNLKTPECLPAPVTSRLGPIYSSAQKSKTINTVIKTNLAPRTTRAGARNGKRQFFASPNLK